MHIKLLNLIVSLGLIFNFWGANFELGQPNSSMITNHLDLIPTWSTGGLSDPYGLPGILITDLNQDGKVDVATCSNGHAYVLDMQSWDNYRTAWFSEYIACLRIAHADRDFNGIQELYISTEDGRVIIIDSATYSVVGTLTLFYQANDFDVADVDGDGAIEIVAIVTNNTFVYDATTLILEWQANGITGNEVEIGNIDADPLPEIVVNGGTGYVLNAGEHKTEWAYSGGFGKKMALGDVDGDGRDEIAFIDDSRKAYVLNGDTQTFQWQLSDLGELKDVSTADVNADGLDEVMIGTSSGGKVYGYKGSDGTALWSIPNPEQIAFSISMGDVNNDGVNEILWVASSGWGADALVIGSWVNQTVEWISYDLDGPFYVDSGDLDLDGQVEIVMASRTTEEADKGGSVSIYNATTHALEWSTLIYDSYFDVYHLSVGQLDLDPALEILVWGKYFNQGFLIAYDGITRMEEWKSEQIGNVEQAILVRNIDEDPIEEIIISKGNTIVQVLNGASNVIQWEIVSLENRIIDIALGDLGLNGNLNMAVLTNLGLYVYDVSTQERILSRQVEGGTHIAMIEADSNERGQLLLITSNNLNFKLEVLEAKSLELAWQLPLGIVDVQNLFVFDLNSDDIQEFIIVGSTGTYDLRSSLLMIGSKTYPSIWKYVMNGNWGQIKGINVSDLDQDGRLELLFSSYYLIQVNEIVATEEVYQQTYIPFAAKPTPPKGLFGNVKEKGAPPGIVELYLRFFNGASWSTLASIYTAIDGSYAFPNLPSLAPGQAYYVLYPNYEENPNRLWTWHTRPLLNYTAGQDINMGDFDVANIPLVNPPDQTVVSLPFTFQWGPRTATPSDSYEFNLFDPYTGVPYFYNDPPLGYVNGYTLAKLPPGFKVNTPYVWEVWVYGPDGGYGISYEAYWVAFSNAGVSVTTAERPSHPKNLPDMDILR